MQASSAPAQVRINHSKKSHVAPFVLLRTVPSHRPRFDLSVARIVGFHISEKGRLETDLFESPTNSPTGGIFNLKDSSP